MTERENLPAKLAAQGLTATTEKRGSLVARGMAAILSNTTLVLTKDNYALYRQARDVWNRITDDGNKFGFGDIWSKNEFAELKISYDTFLMLADAGFEKAYFPLAMMFSVGVPVYSDDGKEMIRIDNKQAQHYAQLSFNWCRGKQFSEEAVFDPEACNDLGVLYMVGEEEWGNYYLGGFLNNMNYQPNYKLAFRYFMDAADAKNSAAMFNLSGMYESGYGVEQNWGKSLYWQIKAAEAGHEKAQRGLEMQHEHGDLESKIDDEQVFEWYVWSAEQGHLWAQLFLAEAYRYGGCIDQDDEQAAHWYMQAAIQGESHAQLQLGKMFWEGRGVERDYEQAEYWLEQSAEQGDSEAQYQFGQFLFEKGDEEEKAVQLIQSAADQGYGPAQYTIASDIGLFDVADEQCAVFFDKAFSWYEEHAKFDISLRLDFALMHLDCWQASFNQSCRANRFDGLRQLEEVASEPPVIDFEGEPSPGNDAQRRASRRLGNELLKHPNGSEVSEAIHWLEQAADLGDAVACVDLAELYLCGNRRFSRFDSRELQSKLVEVDLQAAVYWYERGIKLGWSTAAYMLGREYLHGKYLPQNLVLAEKWLLQAANAGSRSAMTLLGEEYESGSRFAQDNELAAHWYKKVLNTVEEGEWRASYNLARMLEIGKGVSLDLDQAISLYKRAACDGNGHKPSQQRLDELGVSWKTT